METKNQNLIEETIDNIHNYLYVPKSKNHIIRIHTKKLKQLGEISFPLNIKNWHNVTEHGNDEVSTIFEYTFLKKSLNISEATGDCCIKNLKNVSEKWTIPIENISIEKENIHLFLKKPVAFQKTISNCLCMKQRYGAVKHCLKVSLDIGSALRNISIDQEKMSLTQLRLIILKKVANKLTTFTLDSPCHNDDFTIVLSTERAEGNEILCGNVINEEGSKDMTTSAAELYRKRSTDMRLMAEHKYGLRMKSSESWNNYFKKLGAASITIELLQNKPHKNVKVTLNNLSSANKGASFIFYNCARLSALFKEFDKKVSDGTYPSLLPIEKIDFELLTQPEEWELLYVYIMQYPLMIQSCIQDVHKGIINPHYLVAFLSNLCSIFSVYYRRIRILVAPKPHLIPTLYARIYLLKSLEQVFHNTLALLDIEPIKEM